MTENIDPELKEICTHAKLLLPMLSDKTFVPNDADVRRAVERQVSAKRLDSGSELVYPPDTSPLICVQFKNAPLDSPDVLALTDRLNKVRADVAGCLEQNHIGVVRFLQEAPATIGKPNRWTPLASHASRAGKVVERIGEGLSDLYPKKWTRIHSFLLLKSVSNQLTKEYENNIFK